MHLMPPFVGGHRAASPLSPWDGPITPIEPPKKQSQPEVTPALTPPPQASGKPQERSIGVVLLAEPIVVLYANQYSGVKLPRGTRLDVLREHGPYLDVRYGASVLTISRMETIQGVYGRKLIPAQT